MANYKFKTPQGLAEWPNLRRPDNRFPDAAGAGKYKVTLRVPASEGQDLVDTLNGWVDQELEKASMTEVHKRPWRTDEETGDLLFDFEQKEFVVARRSGERIDFSVKRASRSLVVAC